MNKDNHKEKIVNVIKKLYDKQQNIENKLQELSIFYITNKEKYDYDYKLAKIFLDKLQDFIEKEIINIDIYRSLSTNEEYIESFNRSRDNYIIFNYSHSRFTSNIDSYLIVSNNLNNNGNSYDTVQYKHNKLSVDTCLNELCNIGEEILILGMLMNEKKIKCYENLNYKPDNKLDYELDCESGSELKFGIDCECNNQEIKNIMDKYLNQNYMLLCVIFVVMIIFHIMTVIIVILLINHNYNTIATYHQTKTEQCVQFPLKSIQLLNKHNKLISSNNNSK